MSEEAPFIHYKDMDDEGDLAMQEDLTNILAIGAPGAFHNLIECAKKGSNEMVTEIAMFAANLDAAYSNQYLLLIQMAEQDSHVKPHFVEDMDSFLSEMNTLRYWQGDTFLDVLVKASDGLYHRTAFAFTLDNKNMIIPHISPCVEIAVKGKKAKKPKATKPVKIKQDDLFEKMADMMDKDLP